jgi:predicted acylesterase/phospholipase RssA
VGAGLFASMGAERAVSATVACLRAVRQLALALAPRRELRARVDLAMLQRIADASRQGRFLIVNTTDVDDGGSRVWDVGSEAQRAVDSGDVDRVHRILLASSGIPGAFPFREIDGALYVDGGVTGNILYGGAGREERSLPAVWAVTYPELPVPTVRF